MTLRDDGSEIGEYIIGDSAFPLLPWLITPYQGVQLCDSMREFNDRLVLAEVVAKKALARFKDMWRIIQGEMWRPDKHRLPRIVLVCCILHNIVIDQEDELWDAMPFHGNHDECYKQQLCAFYNEDGVAARDRLSLYMSSRQPA
ncbi:hypothetical protein HPP92_017418 [Vanilla planifolia]|uniref:DDE Tnp4 domain-containing protein n=1 Tax=Vanilla planifolia TaxID=51239 RepID=A0A835QCC0_VANPL|nr:hypothetical protein HPP92_017418 [Vanilla planifolia]